MPAPGTNGKMPQRRNPWAGMRKGMAAKRDTMQTSVDAAKVAPVGDAPN